MAALASSTAIPSTAPTSAPTLVPTPGPTDVPSVSPTEVPTDVPTVSPTDVPTGSPTASASPTTGPTDIPTESPTDVPTGSPTASASPTVSPTDTPTEPPTFQAPGQALLSSSNGYNCQEITLYDGEQLKYCTSSREAMLINVTAGNDYIIASLSSSEIDIPTGWSMMTGYVCNEVYHKSAHGGDCFTEAESKGLAVLVPRNGTMLDPNNFFTSAQSSVDGQQGICFEGTDTVFFTGLSAQAQNLVLSARNGQIQRCNMEEWDPRFFVGSIWNGLTIITPALAGIAAAICVIIGMLPYILCGAVTKSNAD
jgi:hypothetical protein